jgi:hypothetical protein
VRTYISGGVVEIVRGQDTAAASIRRLEQEQSSEDRHEGWRYFLEETELQPGMDPQQATRQRWTDFEAREAKAMSQSIPEIPRR